MKFEKKAEGLTNYLNYIFVFKIQTDGLSMNWGANQKSRLNSLIHRK